MSPTFNRLATTINGRAVVLVLDETTGDWVDEETGERYQLGVRNERQDEPQGYEP